MKVSNKKSILHNKYILYFIFFIALGDLLILGYNNDYYSVAIFILIGFLTSFFSKNMIVIMFMAIAFTNIILIYGRSDGRFEGMTTEKTDDEKTDEKIDEKTDQETDEKTYEETDEETDEKKTDNKKTDKKKKKKESDEKSNENVDENGMLSVETNESSNKEKFQQDKNIVYTSEEDKELDKTDKMVISQEKILKSMNKYKPLLDTLQGITKNMAIVKGAASSY
jgi:flagellar biosynthesis GTPase FlhF